MISMSSSRYLLVAFGTVVVLFSVSEGKNYFCDLKCDLYGQGVFANTACQRQNVMCGKGASCGPDFKVIHLTDTDRQYILDLHNYYRNKVAMGRETRGHQPSASNMNTLTYNKELEFVAQCWNNECHKNPVLVHDKCRRTSGYSWVGQNLAYQGSTSPRGVEDKGLMIKKMIQAWYDEVEKFHSSWVNKHEQRSVMIGHYTQMVWADTKEIGCALTYYSSHEGNRKWYNIKLACNYGPGGNLLGQHVYKTGKPGTKCAGRKNNKRYPGLCGVDISAHHAKHYNNDFFKYHI